MGGSQSKSREVASLHSILLKDPSIVIATRDLPKSCYQDTPHSDVLRLQSLFHDLMIKQPDHCEVNYPSHLHPIEKAFIACGLGDLETLQTCNISPNVLASTNILSKSTTLIEHIYTSDHKTSMNVKLFNAPNLFRVTTPEDSMQTLYFLLCKGAKITSDFLNKLNSSDSNPQMKQLIQQLKDHNIECFETPDEKKLRQMLSNETRFTVSSVLKRDKNRILQVGLTVNALVNMEISLNSSAILFLDDKNQVLCVATPKSQQHTPIDQPDQILMLTSVTNGRSLPVDLQFTCYSQIQQYCESNRWWVQISGPINFMNSKHSDKITIKCEAVSNTLEIEGFPSGWNLQGFSISSTILVYLHCNDKKLCLSGVVTDQVQQFEGETISFDARFVCLSPTLCTEEEFMRYCTDTSCLLVYRTLQVRDPSKMIIDNVTIGKKTVLAISHYQHKDPFKEFGIFVADFESSFSGGFRHFRRTIKTDGDLTLRFNTSPSNPFTDFPDIILFLQELFLQDSVEALAVSPEESHEKNGVKVEVRIDSVCYQSAMGSESVPFKGKATDELPALRNALADLTELHRQSTTQKEQIEALTVKNTELSRELEDASMNGKVANELQAHTKRSLAELTELQLQTKSQKEQIESVTKQNTEQIKTQKAQIDSLTKMNTNLSRELETRKQAEEDWMKWGKEQQAEKRTIILVLVGVLAVIALRKVFK